MSFIKYQHVERFGTTATDGINIGKCYVFPKIDGTNASVWTENGVIKAGSRRRELKLDDDNAGFYNAIIKDDRIAKYLAKYPRHRLYGEWLVPHTLRTYREDAWRKFYVFDVCVDDDSEDGLKYLPYDFYKSFLDEFGIDYIAPIKIITNGNFDEFIKCLDANNFLIKDGMGAGEGIVIKNYDYKNRFGRVVWAKIVTSEFRERHTKEMGAPEKVCSTIEHDIVDKFVTKAFVEKEYSKIALDGWESKKIPQLLNTVYHELITEEMWNILKTFKRPTIDFGSLYSIVVAKVKSVMPELFR